MHIPTRQKSHISTSPNRWNFALRKLSWEQKEGCPQQEISVEQKVKIESGWGSNKHLMILVFKTVPGGAFWYTVPHHKWRQNYQVSRKVDAGTKKQGQPWTLFSETWPHSNLPQEKNTTSFCLWRKGSYDGFKKKDAGLQRKKFQFMKQIIWKICTRQNGSSP